MTARPASSSAAAPPSVPAAGAGRVVRLPDPQPQLPSVTKRLEELQKLAGRPVTWAWTSGGGFAVDVGADADHQRFEGAELGDAITYARRALEAARGQARAT